MSIENSSLIKELKEISYQYLDPVSYLKVIGKTPEKFDEKLYQKILDNYDRSLKFYMTAHKESIELIERMQPYILDGKKRIDPKYAVGLNLKNLSVYGVDLSNGEDYIISEVETLIQEQRLEISDRYEEIISKMNEQLNNKLLSLDRNVQQKLIIKGCKILRETNENIYDTTYWTNYLEYLEPVLWKLIEDQGL